MGAIDVEAGGLEDCAFQNNVGVGKTLEVGRERDRRVPVGQERVKERRGRG